MPRKEIEWARWMFSVWKVTWILYLILRTSAWFIVIRCFKSTSYFYYYSHFLSFLCLSISSPSPASLPPPGSLLLYSSRLHHLSASPSFSSRPHPALPTASPAFSRGSLLPHSLVTASDFLEPASERWSQCQPGTWLRSISGSLNLHLFGH